MSQSQAIYPPPKHITVNYNPLDFYDKNEKKTSIVGLDLAVPKIDKGVTYYDSNTQKLKNNNNFLYTESTGVLFVGSRIGINNANPTEALDVVGNIKTNQNISVGGTSTLTGNVTINGNLGIGVSPTTNKLDVTGNVKITGNATTSGLTTTNQLRVTGNYNTFNANGAIFGPPPLAAKISEYPLQLISTNQNAGRRVGLCFANNENDPTTQCPECDISYVGNASTTYDGTLEINMANVDSNKQNIVSIDFDKVVFNKSTSVIGNFTIKNATNETVALFDATTATINKNTTVNADFQANTITSTGIISSYDATNNTNRFYLYDNYCYIRNYTGWNTSILNGWLCVDPNNEGKKIVLYDGGYSPDLYGWYGLSISANQQNYYVYNNASHVFYSGGSTPGDSGTEIMRMNSSLVSMSEPLRLRATFSNLTTNGLRSDCAKTSEYALQIVSTVNYNGQFTGIAFSNDNGDPTTTSPGADIIYAQTDYTNKMGSLNFNFNDFKNSQFIRERMFSMSSTNNQSFRPFITSVSNTLFNTGTLASCTASSFYPFVVNSSVGTANIKRVAIAFCENSNTNSAPGADIMYLRTNASADFGNLTINMTTSATTRETMLTFNPTTIDFNTAKTINTGPINATGAITASTNVRGATMSINDASTRTRVNISPGTEEAKITLWDGGNATNHYGLGVSSSQFNLHTPSATGDFVFYAGGKNGASVGVSTEVFRIKGNGIVQVPTGSISCAGLTSAGALVASSGNITASTGNVIVTSGQIIINNTTSAFKLHVNSDSAYKPTTNTWSTTSDERIKENIELADLDICYENVKNLQLKRFRWKDEIYTDDQINDRNVLGWIAQDVEKIYPSSVQKIDMHGYSDLRTLQADEIYKAQYGATQKLIQKVETLESTVALLLEKIGFLENEISKLKI